VSAAQALPLKPVEAALFQEWLRLLAAPPSSAS